MIRSAIVDDHGTNREPATVTHCSFHLLDPDRTLPPVGSREALPYGPTTTSFLDADRHSSPTRSACEPEEP
jgi:hypothetical protein